ncbi:hypothetical protein AGMMS49525_06200 [Bacteroidia bacterium]|nr:hypothetical protein AGMMS49525_06200 [Bacteroidia bacterium]
MKTKKKERTQMRRGLFISAAVSLSAGLWTLGSAQVKIGGDPTTPVTTGAVLELDGASGGLLLPRGQVLPDTTSASEGTMYYRISDATVYILLIDGGVERWEPVGSGTGTSDIAAKAKKLAFGMDSAKLAGIASGANFVLSVRNANLVLGGTKTFDGTLQASGTLSASGNATFSGTATFSNPPTVPSRNTAVTGITPLTQSTVATEAQVYATAKGTISDALLAFCDSTLTKDQTLNGVKTFLKDPQFPTKTPKFVLISPNATNGPPTFRALLATDIPTLNQSTTGNAATATALSAGTDRTKLDGIATGATKNDPSATNPLANGTAAPGAEAAYSRGDHAHPTQVQNTMTASSSPAALVDAVNTALGNKLNSTQTLTLSGDVTSTATQLNGGSITTTLNTTTVAAAAYGQTAAQTPGWGGTFSVPSFTVDTKGRLTAAGSHNVTIPTTIVSSTASGLMSSAQYDQIFAAQAEGTFLAGQLTGATDLPTYRRIAASDVPILNQNTTGTSSATNALNTPDTIAVSSASSSSAGGIFTDYPVTYTSGGNRTIEAKVRTATASTAGAMPNNHYALIDALLSVGDATNTICSLRYSPGLLAVPNSRLCFGWSGNDFTNTEAMTFCLTRNMRLSTMRESYVSWELALWDKLGSAHAYLNNR